MRPLSRLASFALASTMFIITPAMVIAQDYPIKPVTVVVPQAAGGTNDIVARILAQELTGSLGQQFLVDNRPGAGGNIGTQYAAKTQPDGYTLLVTISSTQAINPSLYKKIPFDPVKDFEPITLLGAVPNVLIVHPSFPANSVQELIALAKTKPGKLEYASAGNGSLNHLLGEMLKTQAGIDLIHVPYKGVSPAITDVLGGHVPMAFASLPSVISFIKDGKLKALGVSTEKRSPALPDVPAMGEVVPGYAADLWIGLFSIAHTPKNIITKLHAETVKAFDSPVLREKLKAQGVEVATTSPEQLAAKLNQDLTQWAQVVRASGAKID
jgi:tripartite-type tricarboxylate transporter receptor subunit TctC